MSAMVAIARAFAIPQGQGDADEVGRRRVARLPTGLATGLIIQHDDGEVLVTPVSERARTTYRVPPMRMAA
jgi:hypothetical protein